MPIRFVALLWENFKLPLFVLGCLLLYLFFQFVGLTSLSIVIVLLGILAGSYQLVRDTYESVRSGVFALDYIAILAISVSLLTGQYLVCVIIVLMLSGGQTLEQFGINQAKKSLTSLIDRIPNEVLLWEGDRAGNTIDIESAQVGQQILVRKGEVVPLDGVLETETAIVDESSLTGEPYTVDKVRFDVLRSGIVNVGNALVIQVTKRDEESTYRKIVQMVKQSQAEKAPLVRLADRYSTVFTIITFVIAGFAYFVSHDINRILAVLVIATPCPLILATPIALMGGVNAAAKKRIIVKKLASLEVMSRVTTVLFDKTGTITLGQPVLSHIRLLGSDYTEQDVLAIASALERSSLHPLAKAFVFAATNRGVAPLSAQNVEEHAGSGISGIVSGQEYTISRVVSDVGMVLQLRNATRVIAEFTFSDVVKRDSKRILQRLIKRGVRVYIFTGDKKESALAIAAQVGLHKENVVAECTPEDKRKGIETFRQEGSVTAMVGDGINDAPALALADVGMVFSNEEQTAASQAADVVFLGGDFAMVLTAFTLARRTIRIALQSILWGIGLSIIGMIFASVGVIPPVLGALLQEVIDICVIFNALRSSR